MGAPQGNMGMAEALEMDFWGARNGRADVRDSQAGMGAMPKFGQVVPMMARS